MTRRWRGGSKPFPKAREQRRSACYTYRAMGLGPASLFGALPARLRPALRRPDGFTLFIIAAALLGAGLAMARTASNGVGLPWDAVNYIGVARNLLDGAGFVEITGRSYTYWAPLYPVLLAAASFPWLDPQDVAGPLNAAALGLAVVASGAWLRRRVESRFLAAWGVLGVALSLPLAWAASSALVTIPFSVLILLALINMERFLHTQRRRDLALASLFSTLAWTMHYTGIALVAFTAALLAIQPGVAFSTKVKRISIYGAIASLPIGLWMARNFLLTGYFAGERRWETESVSALIGDTVARMSQWAFVNLFVDSRYFGHNQWPAATVLTGAAILALGTWLAYAAARSARSAELWRNWSSVYVFAGFALTHALFLTISIALGNATGGNDRFLLPAYVPLLLGVVFGLDRLFAVSRNWGTFYGGRLRVGALAGLCGWLALTAALHPLAIREANANGIGRYDGEIKDSKILEYVSENLIGSETYSNDTWSVYVRTRGRLAPEWRIALDDDGAYIIWLHAIPHAEYDASILRATPGLETVANLADGAVFRVDAARNSRIGYQALYDALAARSPAARAVYDLHLDGRALTYVKSPCGRDDTAARFFLHVVPVDASDLPDERRMHGFDNLNFSFEESGARFDGKCLTERALPDYPAAAIKTGQVGGGARYWEARLPVREQSP